MSSEGRVELTPAAKWVGGYTPTRDPETVSDIGRKAATILGITYGGIHNAPINHAKVDWTHPYFIEVKPYGDLATFDGSRLTALVLAAHAACVRVCISPCNFRHLSITFTARRGREGDFSARHPTIQQAIALYDEHGGMSQAAALAPGSAPHNPNSASRAHAPRGNES